MSEINSVGSSFYFSSLQQANIKAEKNDKKEKVSSKKIKFSDILKKNENLSDFRDAVLFYKAPLPRHFSYR